MLAGALVKYYIHNNFAYSSNPNEINIVYIEGADAAGKSIPNLPNQYNDRRIVFAFVNGVPIILGNWPATTEPGRAWTIKPLNPKGAARIAFGQFHSVWQVGIHNHGKPSAHEALLQRGTIKVFRDLNKDFKRDGDAADVGDSFGVNQHGGWNTPLDDIKTASAGCLVTPKMTDHLDFMLIVKRDQRYQSNKLFKFDTVVLPVADLTCFLELESSNGLPS